MGFDYRFAEATGVDLNTGRFTDHELVKELDRFYRNAEIGETFNLKFASDGTDAPVKIVERLYESYGLLTLEDEKYKGYDLSITPVVIVSVGGLLFIGFNSESPEDWAGRELDNYDISLLTAPDDFMAIFNYEVDESTKTLKCRSWAGADAKCESVGPFEPVSRFGGWPVDSKGNQFESWPHIKDCPLVFQAQYQLPDGRMVWTFANAIEDVLLVKPQEANPEWDYHNPKWSQKQWFDWFEENFKLEYWHYENREYIGKFLPYPASSTDNTFGWGLDGESTIAIVEGGPSPEWVTMKAVEPHLQPAVIATSEARTFPEAYPHAPKWVQDDIFDLRKYEERSFLFQVDDGVGGIDFDFGDEGSLYVFWDGKDRARATIQNH